MSNDVVPKSALQSPILDRFRLLLNEREIQFRVSGDDFDVIPPLTTEEFVRIYEDVLSELTINSKPIITDLTIIAGDFREHSEGISHAICVRVLEVPVDQKMPSLYLLDSIVKNIGEDYVRHFASYLPEVFCEVYRQVPPNLHSSMRRLFGTWETVFPSSVLRQIEDELQLSPGMNQPSSSVASLRASESPRRSHGIHVNPDYLKARSQFDNVLEKNNIQLDKGYDYDQGENSDAQRFYSTGNGSRMRFLPSANKLLPSFSGSGRPLSPSVADLAVSNSPGRIFESGSPSHYGRSRVRGREEEIIDWQKRRRSGEINRGHENVVFSSSNGFDHDRPRALIDAYGHDGGQRSLNKKPIGRDPQILNGAVTKISENSWQNTEEEEFDWENMSPTLADRQTSNFVIPLASSRPVYHGSRGNFGNSEQMLRTVNSQKAGEDAHKIQDGALNLPGILAAPLQNVPAAGRSQLNINGSPQDGNQFKADHFPVSVAGLRPPTSFNNVMPLPPPHPSQNQPRPSFEFMNSSFTVLNQGPQQFANNDTRNSFSMNSVRHPQPGFVPLHHQPRPLVSLPQQLSLSRDFRHNGISTVSPLPPRPTDLGYPVPPFHTLPPYQNASNRPMQFRGPMPLVAPGSRPYSHILPIHQSSVPVTNQPASVNISSLLNSLVVQGLLPSLTQSSGQDSIGVEFDTELLKVRHESAIRALYEDLPRQCTTCGLRFKTQDEHSKHMDWHVTKNRISKNRKHNPSRKWFVSASMWLSGTEALGVDATPGFLPSETVVENKDDEEMAVPADENQTACALCGELFEDFYSDDTEEWMYRGAVYLNTPFTGTAVGMDRSQLGPIVHAKCRSDSAVAPT